ncbi:MAG: hypothetical protein ACXWQO_00495 [Bdellovibrionota bacterium]
MKFYSLLLVALLPITAAANFEGRYQGPGQSISHKSGLKRACAEIFLNFQRKTGEVKILEGGYRCENLQASFDPFTMEVRDGKVYIEGEELGTFSENKLEIFFANKAEDFTYHWLLENSESGMSYLEEWTDGGKPALTVRGNLKAMN